jgi:hypothetical protein
VLSGSGLEKEQQSEANDEIEHIVPHKGINGKTKEVLEIS